MWDVWRNVDGWRPVAKTEREAWPKWPPSRARLRRKRRSPRDARGSGRRKVAQDWKTYYRYLILRSRHGSRSKKFLTRKAKNYYLSPRVEWTEVIADKGRARVAFLAKSNDPAMSKMEPEPTSSIEKWVKTNGNWYLDVDLPLRDPERHGRRRRKRNELDIGYRDVAQRSVLAVRHDCAGVHRLRRREPP